MFDHLAELSEIYCSRSSQWDLIENLKTQLALVWILVFGARLSQKPYPYLPTHHEFQESSEHQNLFINYEQSIIADLHMNR